MGRKRKIKVHEAIKIERKKYKPRKSKDIITTISECLFCELTNDVTLIKDLWHLNCSCGASMIFPKEKFKDCLSSPTPLNEGLNVVNQA